MRIEFNGISTCLRLFYVLRFAFFVTGKSTFMGYLIPKLSLYKNSGTAVTGCGVKGVHAFLKMY